GICAVDILDVGRTPLARVVTGAGPFDLDDVGAHVAEQLGAQRPGENARQVEDSNAGQRPGVVGRGHVEGPVRRWMTPGAAARRLRHYTRAIVESWRPQAPSPRWQERRWLK